MYNFFNKYSTAIAVLYFILMMNYSEAQNLVPNPSFEIFPSCNITEFTTPPPPWTSPNKDSFNSSSYLNSCSNDQCCTIPFNNYGFTYQPAHTGNAYVGADLYYTSFNAINYRQYLQTKLLDSLKANHYYYVSFYVNLQNFNQFAINNVGLLFTDTAIKSNLNLYPYGLIPATPQISSGNTIITDTLNWTKVSGVYKAHGGEKFITLGNFRNDAQTNYIVSYSGLPRRDGSSYYFDDVSVIDSALLPVILSSYQIQQFNHQIINTWQTATEVNVSHFNIQRSISGSGKDFETIGVVMAKGVGKYDWADDAPLSLGRGAGGEALFYRLETVDKDGERMYSDIKKITLTTNNLPLITIKPNPAKDYITIEGKDIQQISIMDALGRLVKRIVPFASTTQIEVKDWVKGIYWIKASNKEGKTVTNKLVVGN